MGKLMFFIIIALVFFWAVCNTLRKIQEQQKQDGCEELPSSTAASTEESMVRCAHCSVHLPRSESITSQGKFFCSDEHRRIHLQ